MKLEKREDGLLVVHGVTVTSEPGKLYDLTLIGDGKPETIHAFLREELSSRFCYCGAHKAVAQTFCRREYFSLPSEMRQSLYNLIGRGYEQAYEAAREFFAQQAKAEKEAAGARASEPAHTREA